jgi:hypothetical protein
MLRNWFTAPLLPSSRNVGIAQVNFLAIFMALKKDQDVKGGRDFFARQRQLDFWDFVD